MKCKLLDVFAEKKLSGNGLTVFYDTDHLTDEEMLALAVEMRQFESAFIFPEKNKYRVKIFTMEEELNFAGHPLIGAAFHLHEEYGTDTSHEWKLLLNKKEVTIKSSFSNGVFTAEMDQGKPEFIKTLSKEESAAFLWAVNLDIKDSVLYPLEVISTGLPYLIIPVQKNIEKAKIVTEHLEDMLLKTGAKFLYVLDTNTFEGRTWDNFGKVEDIATGSAAGPAAAYLHKYGITENTEIVLNQGRFVKRPSKIFVRLEIKEKELCKVYVKGNVFKVADMAF